MLLPKIATAEPPPVGHMTLKDSRHFVRGASYPFAAKCLMVAAIPCFCIPLTTLAAIFPAKSGSSENDSKLRPPRGCR
jgi:hypothetical protein